MGGHHEHLGDIVRVDQADFTGVKPHVRRIDNQQTVRAQLAQGDHVVFRGATAVDHPPVALRIREAHLRQQRACAVIAHHAVADTQ
ncbi:hypothetical protein D3C84_1226630 [compost metagenome]